MKMSELRNTTLQYFQKQMPNVPEYLVRDFVYSAFKDDPNNPDVAERITWLNERRWKQQTLTVTMDIWDDQTQRLLQSRVSGTKLPFEIPRDSERHEIQQKLISQGPSQEPIMVLARGGQYELVEGWHRTIQSMKKWPEGYNQIAWVGYFQNPLARGTT